jgi:hypothetical protein
MTHRHAHSVGATAKAESRNSQTHLNSTNRAIVFVAGTGGSGKSFAARLFGEWLDDLCTSRNLFLRLYDADEASKQDLARFFPEKAKTVDISTREKLVGFLNDLIALKSDADVTLIDLRGDVQSAIKATGAITHRTVEMLKSRHDTTVVVIIPVVAGKPSSMAVIPDWFQMFGSAACYTLILNERDGELDVAQLPEAAREWLAKDNPAVVRLAALPPEIARELEERNCTMGEVLELADQKATAEMEKDYGHLSNVFSLGPIEDVRTAFLAQLTTALAAIFPGERP